jgi:hypothetical protein
MIKPLFAHSKTGEREIAVSVEAGADGIPLADSSAYSAGQVVFADLSNPSDSSLVFLGSVASVHPSGIVLARSLAFPLPAGTPVWAAAAHFQWPIMPVPSLERRHAGGVFVERSVGGALWSVKIADSWREDTVRFAGLPRSRFEALRLWIDTHVRGGADDFTWVDPEGALHRVRLLNGELLHRESVPRTLDIEIRLAVLADNEYA